MITKLAAYRKSILAVVGALATWALSTFPNDLNVQRWGGLAVAVVTALSVYAVANRGAASAPAPTGAGADGPAGLLGGGGV